MKGTSTKGSFPIHPVPHTTGGQTNVSPKGTPPKEVKVGALK
jgi:hypothetical protein